MTVEAAQRPHPVQWTGIALALVAFALLLARSSFLIDDAFISLRYARNWASGAGLVFNPGEADPVEGYSNFLWVALLAALARCSIALETAALVLAALSSLGTLLVLERTLRRDLGLSPATVALATLALACLPPFVVWTSGGLETATFTLLLFWTFARLVRAGPDSARARLATGALGLALALIRVEGFLWVLGLASAALLARAVRGAAGAAGAAGDGRDGLAGRVAVFAGVALGGLGVFVAWRLWHYGDWIANTVHAKAGLSAETLARGARTSASWALLFLWPALAAALAPLAGRARASAVAAGAVVLGAVLYDSAVGGDWMPMFRFLAPASPFAALCLGALLERLPRAPRAVVGLAAIGAALLPLWNRSLAPRPLLEALAFRSFRGRFETEWERLETTRARSAEYASLGRALAQVARPGETMTGGPIGAIGYYSDLYLFDRNGLVDRDVARRAAREVGAAAGHDKRVPRSWFLDRGPAILEVALVKARVAAPPPFGPRFKDAARQLGQRVFAEPGDGGLAQASVVSAHALEAAPGLEAGWTLLVLRPADPASARDFWQRIGE